MTDRPGARARCVPRRFGGSIIPGSIAAMKATRHGEHLVQLSRFGVSNAYLVAEDDGLTVVDTSLTGSAKAILGAARDQGAPIRRIVITHAHADHTGSLDALHDAVPDAEVLVGERDARFLAGDRSLDPGEPPGRIFGPFYEGTRTRPTRTLRPGDRAGCLEAVAAPGHTPGQLAFLDRRDGTLLCGDAYLALGGVFVTTQPVARFPFPALLGTWHKPTAHETAQRLRALDPARLATGHGRVVDAPGPAMDAALAAAPRL